MRVLQAALFVHRARLLTWPIRHFAVLRVRASLLRHAAGRRRRIFLVVRLQNYFRNRRVPIRAQSLRVAIGVLGEAKVGMASTSRVDCR